MEEMPPIVQVLSRELCSRVFGISPFILHPGAFSHPDDGHHFREGNIWDFSMEARWKPPHGHGRGPVPWQLDHPRVNGIPTAFKGQSGTEGLMGKRIHWLGVRGLEKRILANP